MTSTDFISNSQSWERKSQTQVSQFRSILSRNLGRNLADKVCFKYSCDTMSHAIILISKKYYSILVLEKISKCWRVSWSFCVLEGEYIFDSLDFCGRLISMSVPNQPSGTLENFYRANPLPDFIWGLGSWIRMSKHTQSCGR